MPNGRPRSNLAQSKRTRNVGWSNHGADQCAHLIKLRFVNARMSFGDVIPFLKLYFETSVSKHYATVITLPSKNFLLIHFVFVISSAIWFCDESRNGGFGRFASTEYEEMHNCLIEEWRRMIVIGTFWWN